MGGCFCHSSTIKVRILSMKENDISDSSREIPGEIHNNNSGQNEPIPAIMLKDNDNNQNELNKEKMRIRLAETNLDDEIPADYSNQRPSLYEIKEEHEEKYKTKQEVRKKAKMMKTVIIKPKKNSISVGVFGAHNARKDMLVDMFGKVNENKEEKELTWGIEKKTKLLQIDNKKYEFKFKIFNNSELYNEEEYKFDVIFLIYNSSDKFTFLFAKNLFMKKFAKTPEKIFLFSNNSENSKPTNISDDENTFQKLIKNYYQLPFLEYETFSVFVKKIINLSNNFLNLLGL